jgi:hypothetical protein
MSIFSSLFGSNYTCRFEGITEEGDEFDGKIQLTLFNVDQKEVEEHIKRVALVEKGWRVKELKIVAII